MKRANMSIAVIGPVFVDVKGYPLGAFNPAGRNMGRVETVHGGVSRNVAEDLANLGLAPLFVSLADEGGSGDDVLKRLESRGVDTRFVRRVSDGMGLWLAVFDDRGNVAASISKRPDFTPVLDTLEESGDEIFRDCDSIALEIDADERVISTVFRYAEKYGKDVYAVVSNMSIAAERIEYIRKVRCLICNQEEAGLLFSENYLNATPGDIIKDLKVMLRSSGIPAMIVTMGAQGAVYASQSGECGYCRAEDVKAVDTAGAGDAFFAGAAAGLTYGKNLSEACAIGTRVAASVITSVENVCPVLSMERFGL